MLAATQLSALARLAGQPLLIRGDAGLVHSARFAGVLRRLLAHGTSPDSASPLAGSPAAEFSTGAAAKPWETREQIRYAGNIAIVPVCGTLCAGLDAMTAWWMDCCRVESLQAAAATLATRPDIRKVVFDFNSPGGYVTGITETSQLMQRDLAGKLTVAWCANEDCSAAYWLSCACSRIVVAPSATVANVGVQSVIYDYSKMFEQAGIAVKVFKTGAYKGAGVPGTSLTAEQETFVQERVDDLGAQFIAAVQSARPDAALADLQGQWFTGTQAVQKNLADATALNLDELLATLAPL